MAINWAMFWSILLGLVPIVVPVVWGLVKNHFALKSLTAMVQANRLDADQKRGEISDKVDNMHSELKTTFETHARHDDERFDKVAGQLQLMNNNLVKQNTLLELLVQDKIKK
jgi:hypothetical protein